MDILMKFMAPFGNPGGAGLFTVLNDLGLGNLLDGAPEQGGHQPAYPARGGEGAVMWAR